MTAKEIKLKYGILEKEEIHKFYEEMDLDSVDPYLNNSLLHIACSFADSRAVEILINRGIDVNLDNENKDKPLHSLVKREDDYNDIEEIKKCANLLLDNRASVMRKNIDGKTPVLLAAENGEYELIKIFVDRNLKLSMTDKEGNSALHLACNNIFNTRKENEYLEIVKLLIDYGFDLEDKNEDGERPIDIANKRENSKLISILQGLDEDNLDKTKGLSLYEAMKNKDLESVRANLENGCDVNTIIDESGDFKGMSLLGMACYMLDFELVSLLLEFKANPNFKNNNGINSIGELLGYNRDINFDTEKLKIVDNIFKALKDKGLNINDTVDDEANTALIKASKYIDKNTSYNGSTLSSIIAKNLLKNNVEVDKVNKNGESALMYLCKSKRSEALNLQVELLEMGADINLIDSNGDTALIYACSNENDSVAVEMVEMLFEFDNPDINHINNAGKTALDIATENNNEALVKLLLMKM